MNTISGLFGFDPLGYLSVYLNNDPSYKGSKDGSNRGGKGKGGKPWGACKLKICLALWCN
jgi:hypothetical protein